MRCRHIRNSSDDQFLHAVCHIFQVQLQLLRCSFHLWSLNGLVVCACTHDDGNSTSPTLPAKPFTVKPWQDGTCEYPSSIATLDQIWRMRMHTRESQNRKTLTCAVFCQWRHAQLDCSWRKFRQFTLSFSAIILWNSHDFFVHVKTAPDVQITHARSLLLFPFS